LLPQTSSLATASSASQPGLWPGFQVCEKLRHFRRLGFEAKVSGRHGAHALKPDLPRDGVGGELSLDRLEQVAVENGLMLSPVHLTR
jgi:hypothetical protein